MWNLKPYQRTFQPVTLQFVGLLWMLNESFPVMILYRHVLIIWKKFCSQLCNNSKCWYIYSEIFIIIFVNITTNFVRKTKLGKNFQYWEAFQLASLKCLFPLESSNCITLATNRVNCLPWNYRLVLFIFETISSKYLN